MTEPQPPTTTTQPPAPLRVRYRVRFAKRGLLRWISHRDLAQLWERLARRVDLPLSMTEGFHPKPRISFPSALALGTESLDEVVELELTQEMPPAELLRRLRGDQQPGLTIHRVSRLPDGFGKARLLQSDYTISLPEDADVAAVRRRIDQLLSRETVSVERKKKTVVAHVATAIPRLEISGGLLHLSLTASESASLRPDDVLNLVGADDWIERGAEIVRTRVILQREFRPDDPDQTAVADAGDEAPSPPGGGS